MNNEVIEFYSLPKFDQMPLFYVLDDKSPILKKQDFTSYDKLVIYLKMVSNYMDLIIQGRNTDKIIKRIVDSFYEDDKSYGDAIRSDDMYALATACYYSGKDFSNRKKYDTVIEPLIKKMQRPRY